MKRNEMISVAQLVKELERFEKDFPDTNVTCCMPDGTLCYAVGIEKDEEGQVCIGFDEDEEDSGCLEVEMLISDLEMYDGSAMVRMEACGLSMTFHIFRDGSFWYCFKKCVWTQAHQLLRFCKYINISVKAG